MKTLLALACLISLAAPAASFTMAVPVSSSPSAGARSLDPAADGTARTGREALHDHEAEPNSSPSPSPPKDGAKQPQTQLSERQISQKAAAASMQRALCKGALRSFVARNTVQPSSRRHSLKECESADIAIASRR